LWLFIGDTENWQDPMVEFLPVEKTNDKQAEYWLPHIQIDIDTTLTASEIERILTSVYGGVIQPRAIAIAGTVYIVRSRLGVIDGINIFLDLATNSRNVQWARQQGLTKIG
jgi:hypothetical protein